MVGGSASWTAQAIGFGYGALIFSFLGGMWWGLALARPEVPKVVYVAAVLPSLVALLLFFPWIYGMVWPGPSMLMLGGLIAASPLIDTAVSKAMDFPAGWMQVRWHLSLGLGLATLLIGLLSLPQAFAV